SCATCGKGHALLPDFVTLGRLDHVGAIGASLVAGVAPSSGGKPGSPADGPPASTQRSWRRCFASRSQVLAAGFRALTVTHDGELPRELDRPMGPPPLVAVVSLGAAWDASGSPGTVFGGVPEEGGAFRGSEENACLHAKSSGPRVQ